MRYLNKEMNKPAADIFEIKQIRKLAADSALKDDRKIK